MQVQVSNQETSPDRQSARVLAQDAVSAFGSVTDDLSKIRTLHSEITKQLNEFAELVASRNAVDNLLSNLQDKVDRMGEELRSFSGSLQKSETTRQMSDGRTVLQKISGQGRNLAAIATLTRTTAGSLGVTKIDRYLTELHQTAALIRSASTHVDGGLDGLVEGYDRMHASCDSASDAMGALPPKLAEGRAVLDQLSQEEARAAEQISTRADRLVQSGKSKLKSFVSAMQFSDRLAQRLDHIAFLLEMDDPHITRIAKAQAADCTRDIADISGEVRDTMRAMADLGRDGAALFSEGEIAALISEAMKRRDELLTMVSNEVVQVDAVLEAVHRDATEISQATQDAGEKFSQLLDAAERLSMASVNSLLLAARNGDKGAPLAVLASEVRQTATDCLADVAKCRKSLNGIMSSRDDARESLTKASEDLSSAISQHASIGKDSEDRLDQINSLSQTALDCAESLIAMVEAVHHSMSAVDAVGTALLDLSAQDMPEVTAPPDQGKLSQCWALYTMDEERAVHAELYPDDALQGAAADTAEDSDDLDDIFF
ncbi:Methyl-accepting chemotaxis protein 2 [Pelagimonas phthalicica]|uniref:Methyl-accepting chemotaxis protein 2 n=1 Tax=Pelagimonas phthalicica TaxID=1037362 RepID=A0A238JBY4_9RHOB|nr:methyl-accepting chemotaxis protein [Pelagimonas phthalicica]TDS93993.1 hypothetical protein CLV87_0486 [Pelagimonas phthalicica]SMX27482.1 Methyl-accepting chemotaxis protein 2 [Pelagimonas phthalicica]